MEVIIEKVHFEPYPIKDMVTAWECDADGVSFLTSVREHIQELKKVFDTKQDWNYEVANADIYLNGEKVYGDHWDCMPYWHEIDSFIKNLDKEIEAEAESYLIDVDCSGDGGMA